MLMKESATDIPAIAMPGTHERFWPFFEREAGKPPVSVLDIGAGHGAFTKKLHEAGYQVSACDLFPEYYRYPEVPCSQVDITTGLPYADATFDMAVSIEVMEHIHDHEAFFREASRILKPGGKLLFSTPNILSLKARVRFLMTGFAYGFGPLDYQKHDGLQHVSSLTVDQYNFMAVKHGFHPGMVHIDREQKSSRWLLFLYPFIWLSTKRKRFPTFHNSRKLLLGRLLFMVYEKA